ncbi:hypothetical protein Poli38472_011961 [Pythium oligandrum]|uniref:Activating signal cointegrator 1 complex subunit 3 n=1 Tax=Pythium oligandrum TaxID=41045 RepID=A0A8K1CQG1_PYTOL|nr:hypothetical protein Poli38472_011961 [Pythium oligandrum]|eukprot:TMW66845.1 hypothetical protein Poli38472_011961 [Pythium oligandrum]
MTTFRDVLRASFGAPPLPKDASVQEKPVAASSSSKKRPATSKASTNAAPPPPPLPSWMDEFALDDPLADVIAWGSQRSEKEKQLLRVLCVDHVDLVEANERQVTRSAVGAVVTTKKHADKGKKGGKAPPASVSQQLLQQCAQYVAATGSVVFSDSELAETIWQTVQDANGQDDLIQSHLFGLVGVGGMDLIAFVMQHAKEFARGGSVTRQSLQDAQQQLAFNASLASGGHARPAARIASSFTIQTATELLQQKQQRKAQRKARAQGQQDEDEDDEQLKWLEAAGYDLEVLRLQRQFEEEEKRNEPTSLLLREFGMLDGGYDTNGAAGQLTSAGMLTLPESTKRTYFKGYEHVNIPAHAKKSLAKGEELVPISSLEAFAQTTFKGMTHLNRLQSKLFDAAYNTNQNLLVCAPTGAGKTNVAMLTILQEVKTQLQRKQSLAHMKIIYVAPMKALAQEVVTKFGERLAGLKLRVAELTGDMQLTKKEIEETHVIVTTPEKWDVITRKSSTQQALLSQVKLLIIDEVHLLADERGPVIETIVARTVRRVESTQSMIRIVGLSATLPNYVDVATFLRVYVPPGDARSQNAATNGGRGGLFFFDSTYRPVPLDQTFIGVSANATSLKEALALNAKELATTLETTDDSDERRRQRAQATSKTGPAMSKQRQIQLLMNKLTLTHCLNQVEHKEQVMVFVHSRKETAATMRALVELAQQEDDATATLEAFKPPEELEMPLNLLDRVQRSRNKELKELFVYGLGIHHAGMLRADRNLTEELFEKGFIRVLCCTATLAWGVNLPAHSVLIKGTQVYNADKGGITQLSMLDVMQIFGRAGRPQYDTSGDAVLMTTQEQLPHYLRLLTTGIPMESALIKALPDHLNAEIVSGTVSNLEEACEWLSYTYLYVRMVKNPLAYGLKYEDVQQDPTLLEKRKQLLIDAAEKLQQCRMIKILREKKRPVRLDQAEVAEPEDAAKTLFAVTAMGRVASHFYIQHTSIQTFNDLLDTSKTRRSRGRDGEDDSPDDDDLDWERVLLVLCSSNEFEQIKAREDEMNELERLQRKYCRFEVLGGGVESYMGKTNVLLQALIGNARVSSFTLISDTNYVAQNASRVCRALFEICLKKNSARKAEKFLQLANSIDQKLWWDQNVLLQLSNVPLDVVGEVERRHLDLYETLATPGSVDLSAKVRKWINMLPFVDIADGRDGQDGVQVQPFGGNMLRLAFSLQPLFPEWREAAFGRTLSYWIWVEDAVTGFIYHSEYFVLHQSRFWSWKEGTQRLNMECYVPVFVSDEHQEASYVIRVLSDRLVGIETYYEVTYTPSYGALSKAASQKKDKEEMYTKLLTLHPQPLLSLENPVFQSVYASRFQFFNPIQTQTFHQLYHQDGNVLICAPTGSGKTICAELAMLRIWNQVARAATTPDAGSTPSLIVYIAPLKALAREKVSEWKTRFESPRQLRKRVVEVTGDTLVNVEYLLRNADIVVTTPEKWDLLTRSVGVGRALMAKTALVVIDEVHLVGETPRGAVLEVLVSRLRRFRSDERRVIRLLGLSTALANAPDVGAWLGISKDNGGQVYNFRASVRPVPMEVHIQGFPERHYVARMAAMNKPTFMAIRTHSPDKPVLIFVSSKAQTKLTALDLISFCVSHADGSTGSAKPFLKVDESIMDSITAGAHAVQDETLRHTLSFGIGLHHAGLARRDRELVEKLFRDKMIQVVISTSTLAWGVNLPAHLVVIKGTEYFQQGRYQSYPLSDLLQMIGRAGRPSLDDKGVACVLVEEAKKNMIQRLLYEPLAIESSLADHLENHLNAEIASGLIRNKADVVQYLSWSLLFQRVVKNPSFYGYTSAQDDTKGGVEAFFRSLVDSTLQTLVENECVTMDPKTQAIAPTVVGKLAASLYVDVRSVAKMYTAFKAVTTKKPKKSQDDGAAKGDDKSEEQWLVAVLRVICESCVEILEATPLRHHEIQSGLVNELCAQVKYSPLTSLFQSAPKKQRTMLETHGSPVKAFLLLQMHLLRIRMPSSDFGNDLRSLLDQMPRLLSAAIDICALLQHKELVVAGIKLSQGLVQSLWPSIASKNVFMQLPFVTERISQQLQTTKNEELRVSTVEELRQVVSDGKKKSGLMKELKAATQGREAAWNDAQLNELRRAVEAVPRVNVSASLAGRSVRVEMTTAEGQNTTQLANAKRFQKPKPYGFYVLLNAPPHNEDAKKFQLKRMTWKPRSVVQFANVAEASDLQVEVYCDAFAGIDAVVAVEKQ